MDSDDISDEDSYSSSSSKQDYPQIKHKKFNTDYDIYGVFGEEPGKMVDMQGSKLLYRLGRLFLGTRLSPLHAPLDAEDEDKAPNISYHRPVNFIGETEGNDTHDAQAFEEVGATNAGLGCLPSTAHQEMDNDELLPTAFGKRMMAAAEQRRKGGVKGNFATSTRPAPAKAEFEVHTKGIGSKLLAKMGWTQGQGLGKEGKGIAKPLEATMRPKKMGMGYGERKEPKLMHAERSGEHEMKDSKELDIIAGAKLWKRKNTAHQTKRSFKTVEEIMSEKTVSLLNRPMVIDMRGPQARVLSNLEHLNVLEGITDNNVPMPELQHNIRLLVDLAEADIQRLDAMLRAQEDTAEILRAETLRLAAEAERGGKLKKELEFVLEKIDAATKEDNLEVIRSEYAMLLTDYKQEYHQFNLGTTALALLMPRLTEQLKKWSPLEAAALPAHVFQQWRPLLEGQHNHQPFNVLHDIEGVTDPYARLAIEILLPPLRNELLHKWNPRDPKPLEDFLSVWERLLPPFLTQHILHALIHPLIKKQVDEWDPIRDSVPLHTWIHPWLSYIEDRLSELWPVIRHKFSLCLKTWHPADASALFVLSPWKKVFASKDWEQLLGRTIVPQLAACLSDLEINPSCQELEPFGCVVVWADIIPSKLFIPLLDEHFFPKWHAVLRHWLYNTPDYEEVTRWYLGWKGLFPENVLAHERIKDQLSAALNLMNCAAEGKPLPPHWTAAPQQQEKHLHQTSKRTHAHEPTLKELLETFAADSGHEFLPKPGRMYEGLQIYSFAGIHCVIDQAAGVIRAQISSKWTPISFKELVDAIKK